MINTVFYQSLLPPVSFALMEFGMNDDIDKDEIR